MLIQCPGSGNYGYNAKEGILIHCLGFIYHGVILIGGVKYMELDNRVRG